MSTEDTIRLSVRIDKKLKAVLEKIVEEEFRSESRGFHSWDRGPTVSDLVRQGIFIVLAGFGHEIERGYRRSRAHREYSDLSTRIPAVKDWPVLLKKLKDAVGEHHLNMILAEIEEENKEDETS